MARIEPTAEGVPDATGSKPTTRARDFWWTRAESVALARKIGWQIARQRGPSKARAAGAEKETPRAVEKAKASVRAFVEHPFPIVKNIFRHRKVRCRGLARNRPALCTLFGRANVVLGARRAGA